MLSLYSIYGGEDDRDDREREKAGRHNMRTLLLFIYGRIRREVDSGLSGRRE